MSSVAPVSKAELDFTLQALRREHVRVDGRALAAYRRLAIRFGAAHGEVEVSLGPTRALAVCSGEIVTPPPERPNEGKISFHVEFGPMASPSFEVGRPSVYATTVSNFVERLLKGSRAIDAEALCIVGGQKVWSIRVDVRALDDDGNLLDVCSLAALCSVLHFRKADIDVQGSSAQVYSEKERVPVPLSIHHMPVPVSFALFTAAGGKDKEPTWLLDPNRLEEAAMNGTVCVALNQHGELCGLHKPGGLPVDFSLVQHMMEVAAGKAKELTSRIQSELETDLAKRKAARRNVHQRYTQAQLLAVDWTDVALPEEGLAREPVVARPLTQTPARAAWRARARARAAAAATKAIASRRKAVVAEEAPVKPEKPDVVTPAATPPTADTAVMSASVTSAATTEAAAAIPEPFAAVEGTAEEIFSQYAPDAAGPEDALDDVDIAAELEAVEAEAAELEAQLLAAATGEEEFSASALMQAMAAAEAAEAAPTPTAPGPAAAPSPGGLSAPGSVGGARKKRRQR
eukprot:TRINITY_DN17826_c2_g1_i1.p1 TRINITY_DN17826_c2_g1~~TRINITY_DN17826_c2_g1_i1.p1  ORF type:complete len:516 (-),score=134.94 TRINITY_DN17826_c2_g1_i1:74-1621(-)